MNNFLDKTFAEISGELLEDKATRTIKKIRRQARRLKGDYDLNQEQVKFIKVLEKKYGKKAREELMDFRSETLAPLHHIQKKTRDAGLITTKDLVGLTKKEWERAVESGRNKIKKRGEIDDKIESDIRAINHNKKSIKKLEQIRRMITGKAPVNKNLIRSEADKFIKNYNFLSNKDGIDLKGVQAYAGEIKRSWANLEKEISKGDDADLEAFSKAAINILDRRYNHQSFTHKDDRKYDETLSNSVADFYLRRNIINKILSSGDNFFKSFYLSFLEKLTKEATQRANKHRDVLRKRGVGLEFTRNEEKVWGLKKGASPMSGTLSDYYLKIEEEDFDNRNEPRSIEQPEETKLAKKKVENERYNFIQRFRKKYDISEEDFRKIQSLEIFSFIDKERVLEYARKKLKGKASESSIKFSVEKILYRTTSEKGARQAIDRLANSMINKEEMYEKAYKIFSGEKDTIAIRSIVDNIIKRSKTEKEAERRIQNAYNEFKEGDKTMRRFTRMVRDRD